MVPLKKRHGLEKISLNTAEFCRFSEKSQLCFIDIYGRLIVARIIDGKLSVSVYAIYDFYVKVARKYPSMEVIEIKPVTNLNDLIRYLYLDNEAANW